MWFVSREETEVDGLEMTEDGIVFKKSDLESESS